VKFRKKLVEGAAAHTGQKRGWRLAGKIGGGVLLLVVVFGAGLGIGDGRIHLGGSNPRSVLGNLPAQLNYASVDTVYDSLKENYDGKLTTTQLLDGLKHGLAEATGDPYTEYFTAQEAKQFAGELNNSFSGIGAELSQDSDKNLIVIAPLKGYPAAKAGLQPQDIIASIDGKSTAGLSVTQAVNKIRGPSGTTVKLGVIRDKSQTLNLTITRQTIQIPSVSSKILPGNIGYLQIISFSNDTAQLAQKAADSFKQHHVKGIIVDLRDNPGGLLDAAVKVSSLWLPAGDLVVEEKGTIGDIQHTALGGDELHGIPTVVLVNNGSASAAEITTGALHDNGAAYVIGQKSFGKGIVQQLINFGDGSELKVTVAKWYRPNGKNINHLGITPDKAVKLTPAEVKAGTDTQLKAAEAYLQDK